MKSGESLGPYHIVDKIGEGGMGEVYLARDKKLDRNVAIKILNEEFSQDEANLQRFVSEAKGASALNHPNILTIYEFGERKMRVLSSANIVTSKLIVLAATFVMTLPLPLLSLLLAFL